MTPYRKTHVIFDRMLPVALEYPFSHYLRGAEISRDRSGNVNAFLTGGGGWTALPIQLTPGRGALSESANHNPTIALASWNAVAEMAERNLFKPSSDLQGIGYAGGIAAGQAAMQKRVPAGSNWPSALSADETAYPSLPHSSANVGISRVAYTKVTYPANQAFTFRFTATAPARVGDSEMDTVAEVYFGQYAFSFQANRQYQLWHLEAGTWVIRTVGQYETFGQILSHLNGCIHVHPELNDRGQGTISWYFDADEPAQGATSNLLNASYRAPGRHRMHVYNVPKYHLVALSGAPLVTTANNIRLNHPDDRRPSMQISLWRYPASATVVGDPFQIPFYPTPRAPIVLRWAATTPAGCSVDGKLYRISDDGTGNPTEAELSVVSTGSGTKTYAIPYVTDTQLMLRARFTLTGASDGSAAPTLWEASVGHDGYIETPDVDEWTGGIVRDISITGPEQDPSHETAGLVIDDVTAVLPLLSVRKRIPIHIETEYSASDSTKRSVLFSGYAEKNEGELLGVEKGRHNSAYPNEFWTRYHCECTGQWQRLSMARLNGRFCYATDESAPADSHGVRPAWKVTDAVRLILSYAGYTPTMIDVPDHPLRFFPAAGENAGDVFVIQPFTSIGDWCVQTLRDYLGWGLIWDANAGSQGMWRAVAPPVTPFRNMAVFTLSSPSSKLAHRPESYGSTNYVGTSASPIVAPIFRTGQGTGFVTWISGMEGNAVQATGSGELFAKQAGINRRSVHIINPKSVSFFSDSGGSTFESADPTHPDFTYGGIEPIYLLDPSMTTLNDVLFFASRIYDVSCHAFRCARFTAPLVLITDTADANQTRPRPLRVGDAVIVRKGVVDTQYLVRSCNPRIGRDSAHSAQYELVEPAPDSFNAGG